MTSTPAHPVGDPQPSRGPQPDGVNVRAIVFATIGLVVVLILIQPIVGGLLGLYRADRPAENLSAQAVDPGATRHWADPQGDLAATRLREDRHLNHYGWIDREKGVVRIPVERAMGLMVERSSDLRE